MKKLVIAFFAVLTVLSLVACSGKAVTEGDNTNDAVEEVIDEETLEEEFAEDEGEFGEQPELTIYANGGVIWMGAEEPYDIELSASVMYIGATIAEAVGEEIISIEKEGAEFAGWTIYAVSEGEWVQEEVTGLSDGQLCVSCGDYGYYFMKDYEVISETATTDEMLAYESDGRNYYVLANWK